MYVCGDCHANIGLFAHIERKLTARATVQKRKADPLFPTVCDCPWHIDPANLSPISRTMNYESNSKCNRTSFECCYLRLS